MHMRSGARSGAHPTADSPKTRRHLIAVLGLVGWLGLASCGSESVATYTTATDPAELYLGLTLEARAITLDTASGYNTLQLVATPRDGRGEAMAGLPAPTFRLATVGDSVSLRVTPAGLVTALNAGANIEVVAELAVPGPNGYPVRHTDMARVTVKTTTPPQVLASLSIHPIPPDSAVVSMFSNGIMRNVGFVTPPLLTPVAVDAGGQVISGIVIEYTSLDPTIATVDPWSGQIEANFPGRVRLVARATISGITRVDTAVFTVTWPVEQVINVDAGPRGAIFEPSEVRIVPYGVVVWQNYGSDSIDVIFDNMANVRDPSSGNGAPVLFCDFIESVLSDTEICTDGNVHLHAGDLVSSLPGYAVRQFPIPGVYPFHNTRTGATGQVVVTNEIP